MQCGQRFKPEAKSSSTFRTYANAVTRVYSEMSPEIPVVCSTTIQFPRFCRLFQAAFTREKSTKAVQNAAKPPEEVLQDAELPLVLASVDWARAFEGQRANLAVEVRV